MKNLLQKNNEHYAQGDVLYIRKDDFNLENLKFEKIEKSFCVAIGEARDARHLIVLDRDSEAQVAKVPNTVGDYLLRVLKGSVITTHPQHNPDTTTAPKLGEGTYYIGRQWEYDPAQERLIKD